MGTGGKSRGRRGPAAVVAAGGAEHPRADPVGIGRDGARLPNLSHNIEAQWCVAWLESLEANAEAIRLASDDEALEQAP